MIRKIMFKIAGKEDKDSNVPTQFIFEQCFEYGKSLLRGSLLGVGCKKSGRLFLGRNVAIKGKKYCFFGKNVNICNGSNINAYSEYGIKIGDNSKLGERCVVKCTGLQHLGKGLCIGSSTFFDAECYFGAAGLIEIGDNVIAGRNIKFHAENHLFDDKNILIREQGVVSKGIKIGNNCWLGSNITFLDGASVGDGCVVAAGAVVTHSFGDNVVIGGVPAKIIRERGKA